MGFFDVFRRRPALRDAASLADFLDQQAAFLAQRGIYEYSRARAGPHGNTLLREPIFQAAVEKSRWEAYPLALAMVGEMAEGVLRPHAGAAADAIRSGITAQALAVFDRYPAPPSLGEDAWRAARAALVQRLQGIAMHPPKPVKDIIEPFAEPYLNLMPIHEKLRGRDFPALRNYLKVALINMHEEFLRRAEVAALVSDLARIGEIARLDRD
jgi:hypothetical protein